MQEPTSGAVREGGRMRRWGRAIAFGLSGLVLGGMLAFTLSAGAAEPAGSDAATTATQSGAPSGARQDQPCPEGAGGGEAPSQDAPRY